MAAMIRLTHESLGKYFTLAGPENSWLPHSTNIYDFVDRGSNDLLVTVGDSWTHGSSLEPHLSKRSQRSSLVFGNVLSERLGIDWLNLAIPAQGNFWMAQMIKQVTQIADMLHYRHILVICTFTGVTRWFNTWFDQHINYITWFREHVTKAEDFDRLLVMLNEHCVADILDAIDSCHQIRLLIGTNFVENIGLARLQEHQILSCPWYEVMGLKDTGPVYSCMTYSRLEQALEFIDRDLHIAFKSWMLELIEKSDRRIRLMIDHPAFRQCHPLADGHRAWADYIYGKI